MQDTETLEVAVRRMKELGCSMVPVVQAGRVIGLLSMENIGEWLMIQAALHHANVSSVGQSLAQAS